ncbi:MAG: phosphopyruvate hydratase [Verrucomicrobia bacterium]|nr:phosphopyruvate hydratase [Verrucomicrobiota bacterium]
MSVIKLLTAREILDSRGRPTVKTTCELASGAHASASVPSGASTGSAEALELRDGEPKRYRGLGCRKAVANVAGELNRALCDRDFKTQAALDRAMIELDGTPNKSRLGANAILSVSLAFARAVAVERGVPLYQHFADLLGEPLRTLPRPTINLFSGGKHAGGQVPIQDVLLVPASARTMDEALAMTFAVYQCAAELTQRKYSSRPLKADEGGLAPPFPEVDTMLADAVESIRAAGLEPGRDVALALDVAASHFFRDGHYHLGERPLSSREMIAQLSDWLDRYPIVSLEDGLAENDWPHWPLLRERVGARARVLGDDLLCTTAERIRRAIDIQAVTALLLKVNQIGTLTEAAEARRLARSAGWLVTVSARSGETEDDWLADLAVGWSGDQIKIGSITQSERLAKYNRLLEIEAETRLPLHEWPGGSLGISHPRAGGRV